MWTGAVRDPRKRCMNVKNYTTYQKSLIWQVNQFYYTNANVNVIIDNKQKALNSHDIF